MLIDRRGKFIKKFMWLFCVWESRNVLWKLFRLCMISPELCHSIKEEKREKKLREKPLSPSSAPLLCLWTHGKWKVFHPQKLITLLVLLLPHDALLIFTHSLSVRCCYYEGQWSDLSETFENNRGFWKCSFAWFINNSCSYPWLWHFPFYSLSLNPVLKSKRWPFIINASSSFFYFGVSTATPGKIA